MIKQIVLYYFYTFLLLDTLLGFLLKYMALENVLTIHPGHIVRGILLFILIYYFFKKIFNVLDNLGSILLYIFFICIISLSINYFYGINYFIEIYNLLKSALLLLVIYFIHHNKYYFFKYKERIIDINFCVLSANIFFSYFTGIGIESRDFIEGTTKGMFYAGNAVSVLLLAFFVYYLFSNRKKVLIQYAYSAISVIAMYIVSTKAIFAVPGILGFYILFRHSQNSYLGFLNRLIASIFIVGTIAIFSTSLLQIYNQRYYKVIKRTNIIEIFDSSDISALEEYRRVYSANVQLNNQITNPLRLIVGYGKSGQMYFWEKRGYDRLQYAAMDFVDIMFQYGIFYALLIYYLFLKTILKNEFRDPIILSMVFIVTYSFFGGYVLYSLPISSLLAFFTGLKYSD